jgi:hypothetical protein
MSNAIIAWAGADSAIPYKWLLCNGANGTPSLGNKFIRGAYAAGTRPSGTTGGSFSHAVHTIGNASEVSHNHDTIAGHYHDHTASAAGTNYFLEDAISGIKLFPEDHLHTINGANVPAHDHDDNGTGGSFTPSYYKLAYIMCEIDDVMPVLPTDAICMWTGSDEDVPSGWHFCDGTDGTPDLRDLFLFGYKAGTNIVGDTGGSASHTHSLTNTGGHTHTITTDEPGSDHIHGTGDPATGSDYGVTVGVPADIAADPVSNAHNHDGATTSAGTHTHTVSTVTQMTPYYTLAYLVKVA